MGDVLDPAIPARREAAVRLVDPPAAPAAAPEVPGAPGAEDAPGALHRIRARDAEALRATLGGAPRGTVPLRALLHAVRDQVAMHAAARPVAFRIVPAEGEVTVEPAAIVEALAIVLDHAIEGTPAGGRVAVTAQRVEDEVVFAVFDAGRRDRSWARDARDRERVQAIVRAHGGRLWVDGYPGHGNVLLFTVPARAGA